jgi:hypothetical protein
MSKRREAVMNEQLVQRLIELVISLSSKPRLTGPEFTTYLRGLTFVENQYKMYNAALESGIEELEREHDDLEKSA